MDFQQTNRLNRRQYYSGSLKSLTHHHRSCSDFNVVTQPEGNTVLHCDFTKADISNTGNFVELLGRKALRVQMELEKREAIREEQIEQFKEEQRRKAKKMRMEKKRKEKEKQSKKKKGRIFKSSKRSSWKIKKKAPLFKGKNKLAGFSFRERELTKKMIAEELKRRKEEGFVLAEKIIETEIGVRTVRKRAPDRDLFPTKQGEMVRLSVSRKKKPDLQIYFEVVHNAQKKNQSVKITSSKRSYKSLVKP